MQALTKITRRTGLAALTLALMSALGAQAQDYPSKPIRLIAPFPAGSGPDANAREIAGELTKILGQTVIVDNRPGASGIIGTDAAAKAAPDGYTLLVGTTSTLSVLPHLYNKLPFNAEKDFAPVSLLGLLNTGLMVTPSAPFKTVAELVARAKANPGTVTTATLGAGSYYHLAGEWFGFNAGIKLQFIPYGSVSPYSDLLSGQVQVMFDALPAAAGNIRAGKLRLLALTGATRHPAFPDVPTFAEAGIADYGPLAWQGILAPAGTPKAIVDKLSAAMQKATQNQQLAEKWRSYGGELKATTPAEFSAFIKTDSAKWGEVTRRAGVKLD
jgi:tripartite-type tricarboxylate transporter receptor subunit TctC